MFALRRLMLLATMAALFYNARSASARGGRPDLLASALPPIQQVPSPSWPFIFFHTRKSGGSALRPKVAMAADELNLTFFIPCLERHRHNIVNQIGLPLEKPRGNISATPNFILNTSHVASCNQYHIGALIGRQSTMATTSVFAGHFFWDSSALEATSITPDITRRTPPFSCLIMVREPVARFQSCYAERFQKTIGLPLGKLLPSQLSDLLANYNEQTFRNGSVQLKQGCNNEIARWISPDMGWGDAHVNRGELSQEAIDETKRRISQCTIGDISGRTNDTLRVIRHWHPWLTMHYKGDNSGHRTLSSATPLSSATIAAIRQANTLDLELYAFAMKRFELMLHAVGQAEKKRLDG